MVRAREDRIRTFMQLELEACLEEVCWSIRCYNCEVLGCPQEEYPARLLPTLSPNYEDNLQNRLRRAEKGILPARCFFGFVLCILPAFLLSIVVFFFP